MCRSVLLGTVKVCILSCNKIRTLNYADCVYTVSDTLCDCGHIVLQAVGKGLLLQPAACKGVSLYHNKQWIESHSLKA